MKLRGRLLAAVLVLAVPIVAGFALYTSWAREQALVDATLEATIERMESGGRERCESGPDRLRRRPPRRPGVRLRRAARRARRAGGPARSIYDANLVPLMPHMPPLEPELAAALRDGEESAAVFHGNRVRIAMRMPWDGPCAVIVVDRFAGQPAGSGYLRSAGLAAAVVALTALAALFALGPVVRRIRRLEGAVRGQASTGYEGDVPVEGKDEVADLAKAFNHASAQIRLRLEELTARDKALTEFLQSTTHDVMIPLTVLQGHLSSLRNDGPDETKLHGAIEEAHYLAALLRNLNAAARLDAGEPMIARHDLDLADVVERVVSRHRPIAKERGVALDFAVPEGGVKVKADSTLLEQMVGNLVSNAIRYNERGGHVAVILEKGFVLTVKDDGPGIPEEELERVADRKFRGGAARQRRPTGLGIGLHIVRDVAERHGYRLSFESPEEGGLTVTIEGRR